MRDLLTWFALVGAAVSFALYLALANARQLARVSEFASRIPRSSLAVFLAFALVATLCAQKGGTNAPPNGASPPQMVPPSGGNVELTMENVPAVAEAVAGEKLRNLPALMEGEQHHNSPFSILHSQFPTNAAVTADSPEGSLLELPYSWYGCAGDVGSMDIYVTNNDPSRAGEPVEFMIEFDGEDGDYDSDVSGLLEVVRYRVEADAAWPSNKVRHVFGPLETFKAIIENGPEFIFNAPLTPGECNMSFDYNNSTCTFPIRVIPPSGVAGYWRADDFGCSGSTIGAGFFADVQVLPVYVSFKDLWIMEGESGVSGRWGCFENVWKYQEVQFAHTPAIGALRTLRIIGKNMVDGWDHVQTKLGELPSENGGFTLNIPLKWGISGGPCINDAGHVLQTTSVQANGKVTVSKFGITRGREPYGLYEGN